MHESTTKSALFTALLLALAPATGFAADSADSNAAQTPLATFHDSTAPLTPVALAPQVVAKLPTIDNGGMVRTDRLLRVRSGLEAPDVPRETDLWGRIRTGYAIPDIDNKLVAQDVQWYVTRPDYLARTTARASLYLYHVVQELEKRGMPTELALLPFIESAFNPNAMSSANASGMWQFVPATGRDFNLKQTMFKDERRGVLASTDAALTYLQRLYDMFGDWQLALAAYNWGEGSVQRAIDKNRALGKPTDFESLAYLMPAETRNYVPKLQAVKNIIANPGQYGLSLPLIDNHPYFTAVDKTSDIDVTIAAQLAELSVDDFKALNPQFNRPVITGGDQTKILLPVENASKFTANLASWGHALSTWTTHKIVGARERLDTLAQRFGTSVAALRAANDIPRAMDVRAGSTILVPKMEASLGGAGGDIPAEVADNARMMFQADRPATLKHGYRQAKSTSASRVPRALAKRRDTGHH